MQLYTKILIGLIAGGTIGAIANAANLTGLAQFLIALEPIGTGFIRLITMIVVPLVVASLLVGTASLGDMSKLGRIGGKTLGYYMFTTAIAVTIGLGISNLIKPGSDVDPATRDQLAERFQSEAQGKMEIAAEAPSVVDVLLKMIPRNPIQAAAEFDLLGLIFFSLVFGAAVSVLPEAQKTPVLSFFEGVNNASMIIIGWVMKIAPYAVFALIAAVVAQFGLDLLRSLFIYSLVVVSGTAHPLVRHRRDTGAPCCGPEPGHLLQACDRSPALRLLDLIFQRDAAGQHQHGAEQTGHFAAN